MSLLKLDEETELCSQVKQLIVGFTSHVSDVESIDKVQNAYMHMEECDRDFDRYEFVKALRASIEESVGSMIDNEIERHVGSPGHSFAEHDSLISEINSRVLHSHKYGELLRGVRDKVERTCDYLLSNFDQEFQPSEDDFSGPACLEAAEYRHRTDLFFSDAESSIGDSLNQSTMTFMNADWQRHIVDGLSRLNGIEVRRSAMKDLLQANMDVLNSDMWPTIRIGLRDALLDEDDILWPISLRFIARSLSTNCHEVYHVLVEFLEAQFMPGHSYPMPLVRDGLDITKPHIMKVFKAFRLLNSFLQLVPHYSQRYQEGTLNEILESTLALLNVNRSISTPGRFLPIHFLALVDCKATWLVNLMHSKISRVCLLKSLEDHSGLVESSVRTCMNYIAAYITTARDSPSLTYREEPKTWYSENPHCHYTGFEVEYALFLHSLRFIGRLILYDRGRRFFPIGWPEIDQPVTVVQVVVAIVRLATHLPRTYKPDTSGLNPHQLAVDILTMLCSSEDVCQKVMCCDAVTDAILEPINQVDGRSLVRINEIASVSSVLANVSSVLLAVASTCCGHQHLLYGEGKEWSISVKDLRSTPVHTIVKFSIKLLALNNDRDDLSCDAVNNMLRICRLLYHRCGGLFVVGHYDLHNQLVLAWRDAKRVVENVTPTPMASEIPKERRWEEQLRDNLLNFAWTPKGVLLLQKTGAFRECVQFMYSRYERKLQVSSCEKFGYGYLMSQVAATAPGILALDQTGFTSALIRTLWETIEVVDNGVPCAPRCWPVSPVDKLAKKPFTNIVNLLSSFLSVYEILEHESKIVSDPEDSVDSFQEVPATVSDLFDKLIFLDSVDKIKALFNYEQSHMFGLQLLSILTSCLDTLLLLEGKYSFQELLLQSQSENTVDGSQAIILDMLSLERNYILVKTYVIGGPSERRLPQRTIENRNANLDLPLFSSYPVPIEYIVSISHPRNSKEDLMKLNASSRKYGSKQTWVEHAQNFLATEMMNGTIFDTKILFDMLEKVVDAKVENSWETYFPQINLSDSSGNKTMLTSCDQLGVAMVVRYGCQLHLLSSEKDGTEKLTRVVRKFNWLFQQHSANCSETGLSCLRQDGSFVGFDWFAATVFLMTSGNADRTEKFLSKFSMLLSSGYIWSKRLMVSSHMLKELTETGIPPMYFVACHHIEHILQLELPHVYSVFNMSGYSPAQICQHWLRQCFWNYLDWTQVCEYVALCVTLGADYSIYICIAVLRHLQTDLMTKLQDNNLIVFLKEESIHNFRIGNSLEYMQFLQKKFRSVVFADMQSVAG